MKSFAIRLGMCSAPISTAVCGQRKYRWRPLKGQLAAWPVYFDKNHRQSVHTDSLEALHGRAQQLRDVEVVRRPCSSFLG